MRLRALRADDADVRAVLDAFAADPVQMSRQGEVTDLASARAHVETLLQPMVRATAVVDDEDRLLGLVGVSIDAVNRLGRVHYWMHPAHRGSGLMRRAVREVADRALAPEPEGWGLERLELGHRANNPVSGGVARAAGFVLEGREREKFLVAGERIDVLTYGRLRRPHTDDGADALPSLTERRVESHQPYLHDLVGVFHAPLQAWSAEDGEIDGAGAQGIYLGDTRVVSDVRCVPIGVELSPLRPEVRSAREILLRDVVTVPGSVADPLLTLERRRTAGPSGLREELRLRSDDDRPHRLRLRMHLVTDAASMSQIKDPALLATAPIERPEARADGARADWAIGPGGGAVLDVSGGGSGLAADGPVLTWTIELEIPGRGEAVAAWRLDLHDPTVPFTAAEGTWPAGPARSSREAAADPERRAVDLLLRRSLSDLDALRLDSPAVAAGRARTFFAAGAPWFLTLFGRDSLIAASLVLPLDTAVAEGTLRALAAQQGTRTDVDTAQQPGKILHEVRAQGMVLADGHLPPVYYGTIDATPLWITLLHDALAAGMDPGVLRELRGALVSAARWLLEHADADGDGLLEYLDESGHGLANQGWKDSGDSIRYADGTLAPGPIALAEVQGYAYAAAGRAAELLERLEASDALPASADGEDLPARLRAWAAELRAAFHRSFWVRDELGPYIALALDGRKRAVDGVASNMGHLLGTGILDAPQERIVADRLLHPTLFSGYGIRTLSTTNGGYGPLTYHCGSVWTHDTAVIVRGMLRAGLPEEAAAVARGLLRAAPGFGWRLPELFGGHGADEADPPLPYPPSCRPQAWAAASAVAIAQALGGV